MFSRQFFNSDSTKGAKISDPALPRLQLADFGYGKRSVRVFQVKKNTPRHEIIEYLITSHMRLRSHKEYYNADNSDIIGSDVQQSAIYIQAQKHGLTTPEQFALHLTQHFLDTYMQAMASNVLITDHSWIRIGENNFGAIYANESHNHAFLRCFYGQRFCEVVRNREDAEPLLICGIRDLRLVKTAKAPFIGYVKGSLYTEGDNPDRIFCIELTAKWQYSQLNGIDWSKQWFQIRDIIIENFAGDVIEGIITTSAQYVAYTSACAVLKRIPEICSVSVELLNLTHLPFDFSRFPPLESKADVIISAPTDVPCSVAYAQVDRKDNDFIYHSR